MRIATIIARTLLGLVFVVFGLNGFLHFIPMGPPPPPESPVGHFFAAFASTGYLQVVAVCQVVGGLLLLVNFLPVLGLTILCPIIFNIIVFHATLARNNFGPAVIVSLLTVYLLWAYWDNYRALFRQPAP